MENKLRVELDQARHELETKSEQFKKSGQTEYNIAMDSFKVVSKEKDMTEFYYNIIDIPMMPTLFPTCDDDEKIEKCGRVAKDADIDNMPWDV